MLSLCFLPDRIRGDLLCISNAKFNPQNSCAGSARRGGLCRHGTRLPRLVTHSALSLGFTEPPLASESQPRPHRAQHRTAPHRPRLTPSWGLFLGFSPGPCLQLLLPGAEDASSVRAQGSSLLVRGRRGKQNGGRLPIHSPSETLTAPFPVAEGRPPPKVMHPRVPDRPGQTDKRLEATSVPRG